MKEKFTPGPWSVDAKCVSPLICSNNVLIATCFGYPITEEVKANAALIAAAPDLYKVLNEACNRYMDAKEGDVDGFMYDDKFWRNAMNQLAKSRGEK